MSKFRGFRKKLIAGLCAFTSGVGGTKAVDNVDFSAPIFTKMNDCYCLGDGTKVDRGAIDKIANFGMSFKELVTTKVGNKTFTLSCTTWRGGDRSLTFRITNDFEVENMEQSIVLIQFNVPLAYIVHKLGIKTNINGAPNDISNVNDMSAFLGRNVVDNADDVTKTVRFKLTKLVLFDVLGITPDDANGIYGSATQAANIYNDVNYNTPLTSTKHPDFAGCFARYIVKNLLNIQNAIGYDENNKINAVNQKAIWEHFFGTIDKPNTETDYYKTMKMNPKWPTGAKVLPWLFGVPAVGLGLWTALDELYLKPRERENVDMEIASLEGWIEELKPRAMFADKFEKVASKSLSGKNILKKVKGDGKKKDRIDRRADRRRRNRRGW